ncbi:ABC transporter permease [Caenibacillus caldisaponilyticus]|uniref:ABC transporter permease n=1 Tax=Caenibacillus caldisaponilyticus TaxID=1674942 RepID=UPI0009885954|nr:ABC transporter permease [Caenibacillus caldisaponilyticus]
MGFITSIKMALRNIKGNKLRAFLTMLGIIIGVSSVIVLVAIGQGSTRSVTDSINNLGTNLITVNITTTDPPFSLDNINAIKKLNGVKNVSPVVSGRVTLKNNNEDTTEEVNLLGSDPAYKDIRILSVSQGRFISDIDMKFRQKVAVIGSTVAQNLFGNRSPIDQSLLINGDRYTVVGVLASKGGSMGQNIDETVIIPFTTAQRFLNTTYIQQFYAQADSAKRLDFAMLNIERYMAQVFNYDTDNYSVFNQQDVMDTMASVNRTLTLLLGGIASISLIVGGIGIMNIMFVSVTERTKEIGIRKSIGAKRKNILLQFLIEASVLSALGGLIGVGLGIFASELYGMATGTAPSLSLSVIGFVFLFSVAIGVIFGVFPANKAAKLPPIQALRFD